jgi:glycosyltransferase involved in cell wall biosynthesis
LIACSFAPICLCKERIPLCKRKKSAESEGFEILQVKQMNRQPLITVVTASLNADATIRNTLESVRSQRKINVEHIVCDGGSTDDTLPILKEFSGAYNLRWISEPDNGIAQALNKGFTQSSGRYILVLQADDQLLSTGILEMICAPLEKTTHDIFSYPVIVDHPTKGPYLRKPIRPLWWNRFKFVLPHQGCFVHRRVFERIGGFRPEFKINMDYDFFYRALNAGCSVFIGDIPTAIMGGAGIGTRVENVFLRLDEERRVQSSNENNRIVRLVQQLFYVLYFPYKKHRLLRSERSRSMFI